MLEKPPARSPPVGSAFPCQSDRRCVESKLTEILVNARIVRGNADVTPFGARVTERLWVRAKRAAARGRKSRKSAQ